MSVILLKAFSHSHRLSPSTLSCMAYKHSIVINVLIIEKQYLNCSSVREKFSLQLSSMNYYDALWKNVHDSHIYTQFIRFHFCICFNNSCWIDENIMLDNGKVLLLLSGKEKRENDMKKDELWAHKQIIIEDEKKILKFFTIFEISAMIVVGCRETSQSKFVK